MKALKIGLFLSFLACICLSFGRKLRSVPVSERQQTELSSNSVEYILSVVTVARGDTAVLHCSFDAIIQTLPDANIEWYRGKTKQTKTRTKKNPIKRKRKRKRHGVINMDAKKKNIRSKSAAPKINPDEYELIGAMPIATGKRLLIKDARYRVFRPRNTALSVMIIRRTRKSDAGIYRCNLSHSSTRHRYMVLNVTESKIEAQTSLTVLKSKVGEDVTLWCNATGYPKPVVYWMRKDRNRTLPDGNLQFWGNGLQMKGVTEMDTGVYECFLDNFVQPIVNYRFTLMVEDSNPWSLEGYKMRFDSKRWHPVSNADPFPMLHKSFLLMCDTRGFPNPLPVIRWYRNGEVIRNSKHYYIIEEAARKTYTSSTLVIMHFTNRFSGRYSCVGYTSYRMKKVAFDLKVFPGSQESVLKNGENDQGITMETLNGDKINNKMNNESNYLYELDNGGDENKKKAHEKMIKFLENEKNKEIKKANKKEKYSKKKKKSGAKEALIFATLKPPSLIATPQHSSSPFHVTAEGSRIKRRRHNAVLRVDEMEGKLGGSYEDDDDDDEESGVRE